MVGWKIAVVWNAREQKYTEHDMDGFEWWKWVEDTATWRGIAGHAAIVVSGDEIGNHNPSIVIDMLNAEAPDFLVECPRAKELAAKQISETYDQRHARLYIFLSVDPSVPNASLEAMKQGTFLHLRDKARACRAEVDRAMDFMDHERVMLCLVALHKQNYEDVRLRRAYD